MKKSFVFLKIAVRVSSFASFFSQDVMTNLVVLTRPFTCRINSSRILVAVLSPDFARGMRAWIGVERRRQHIWLVDGNGEKKKKKSKKSQ